MSENDMIVAIQLLLEKATEQGWTWLRVREVVEEAVSEYETEYFSEEGEDND